MLLAISSQITMCVMFYLLSRIPPWRSASLNREGLDPKTFGPLAREGLSFRISSQLFRDYSHLEGFGSGTGPSYFSIVPPQRVQGGSSWPFFTCMTCPHWRHL